MLGCRKEKQPGKGQSDPIEMDDSRGWASCCCLGNCDRYRGGRRKLNSTEGAGKAAKTGENLQKRKKLGHKPSELCLTKQKPISKPKYM